MKVPLHEGVAIRLLERLVVCPSDHRLAKPKQSGRVEGIAVVTKLGVDAVEFAAQLEAHRHQVGKDHFIGLMHLRTQLGHQVAPRPEQRTSGAIIEPTNAVVGLWIVEAQPVGAVDADAVRSWQHRGVARGLFKQVAQIPRIAGVSDESGVTSLDGGIEDRGRQLVLEVSNRVLP